jgi:cysteinyl-tRNA synthetase
MSRALLGKHFDIHTGGIDHIPVHHTNELAQSECANGCPYVNYWLHGAFLTINQGEKMAKSGGAGDLFSLAGIVSQGYEPLALRYYFLGAHYRTQMDFSWEALKAAQNGFTHLKKRVHTLTRTTGLSGTIERIKNIEYITYSTDGIKPLVTYAKKFDAAVYDDLNTAQALAALHEVVGSNESPERVLATVAYMDDVLGLKLLEETVKADNTPELQDIPQHIQHLLDQRATARAQKNWAESDRLRDTLAESGYSVKDTSDGQVLTKLQM